MEMAPVGVIFKRPLDMLLAEELEMLEKKENKHG